MLAESYYVSFGSAVKESPTDLYEGYSEIKELLLKRSLVSHNRPLYFAIVDSIVFYKINGSFLSPCDYILIKSCDTHKRSEIFIERVHHYLLSLDLSNKDDIVAFLKEIGIQGIHILSGMRHTTGTYDDFLPPCADVLVEAFRKPFNNSGLTHGGRALSKHSIRDSSCFWGKVQGTSSYVNASADSMLDLIVRNSVWHNVFALPHNLKAYEIRVLSGYGARWEFGEGYMIFRGFVEPPMEDGHAKKWRH